ncbi:peptidoglycan-binding protein [Eubacterium multiforme]|uniref:N-acetylmuramoyl-L-alanine amidase n=1 Tax=Eubacterium multiforme TaxID=83339 RepID=A0ABT9UW79_9FIRM|nr:peptidoglycan-binding protein [Eubacterium multiforme]MDQ0150554.1 N-acetylmuramoyl-L-alanine amidase [Eubacterium multiforme]
MKIAVRGGHNFSVPGASGIISETREDRKVKDSLIKYLRLAGQDVLDVTPPDSCNTVSKDLAYGVNKANNWGADLYIPIHFNNCYNHYNGAIGAEVYVYSKSFSQAKAAMSALAEMGFKNRGVKSDPHLYDLRKSNMDAMLLEICFVEATEDVELYRKLGPDEVARRIAQKICSKSISSSNSSKQSHSTSSVSNNSKLWQKSISGEEVKALQSEINRQGYGNIKEDGYFGDSTLNACPMLREGARGNITKLMQQRLLNRGYTSLKSSGGADGVFGRGTTIAIKNLQKNKGLDVDGIVGKNTWKALYSK